MNRSPGAGGEPPTGITRRRFLAASTALAAGAVAGCSNPSTAPARPKPVHVPEPTAVAISRWASDPWARGLGSVVVPGADLAVRVLLGTPVRNRLFFASEATSVDHPSSADGSWAAGQLAAQRVLDVHGTRARVIVVGAGLAGVAATQALDDAGADVTTFEATDRIGGQARTASLAGVPVDLGWGFVDDARGAPLQKVVDELHLPHRALPAGEAIHDVDGSSFTAQRAAELQVARDRRMLRSAQVILSADGGGSFGQALDAAAPGWKHDREIAWSVDDVLTQRRGVPPAELAQAGWLEPTATAPVVLRRGVAEIAQVEAGDTDLRLNTPVHSIDWRTSRVVVHTLAAASPADAVIVTAPIGVLRAGVIGFTPALPGATQAALAGLRPGVVDRVAFRFPKQFWGDDGRLGRISATPGRFTSWINLAVPTGAPVLVGTVAGPVARALEPRSDAAITREALESLRAMFA